MVSHIKSLSTKITLSSVTTLRIGLVLSKDGGILKKLIQINKLRISNVIDGGKQCFYQEMFGSI